jgi:polysaccharide deacetylase family protein (PEP-CTERM system associated)
MTAHAFTVDVEDWFHILDCPQMPSPETYGQYESRVLANTELILSLLDEFSVKGTFFVLGWVADRHPGLVRHIVEAGHELGVHGYHHVLAGELSDRELEEDTRRAISAVAEAAGMAPVAYRSPGGSLLARHFWLLELLPELGIKYDSSVYPRPGGLAASEGFPDKPYAIVRQGEHILWEFPSTIRRFAGIRWAFAEGGYLRLLPERLVARWFREREARGLPVACCLHPREFDPHQPRLPLSPSKQWRTVVGLKGLENKVRSLLEIFEFQPMGVVLQNFIRTADLPDH